jgi:hypothetical protein
MFVKHKVMVRALLVKQNSIVQYVHVYQIQSIKGVARLVWHDCKHDRTARACYGCSTIELTTIKTAVNNQTPNFSKVWP